MTRTPFHRGGRFGRILLVFQIFAALGLLSPSAVAQLAAKPAQDWINLLESSNRLAGLKIEETVERLKIKPGSVIADIGAGSGLFTVPLARAALPGGTVYAVDIDQGLIDHIAKRAAELQATNVHVVLGKYLDPNLPVTNVDLALVNDVLHHIEHRATYLKNLATHLQPTGRIAIIDFHPELGIHKNEPALQVTKAQCDAWMAGIGFRPVEEHNLFSDKWFVVYSRQE